MTEFKLIIAGGRDFDDAQRLRDELIYLATTTYQDRNVSVVSGMARGADKLGYVFAKRNSVKTYAFPAEWHRYGKTAGFKRNADMGRFADGLLAFWNGRSKGTKHMIDFMTHLGKPVHVVKY